VTFASILFERDTPFLHIVRQDEFSKERVAAASGRTRLTAREGSRSGKEGLSWLANQAGIRTAS